MDVNFEGLTKRRTKLRKFLLLTLLAFLMFSGMAAVLTRNQIVQNYLAKRAATYLSKEWKTKVEIGYVSIDFLRTFHIENLRIYDKHQDTLIQWGALDARIDEFSWTRKHLFLENLSIKNLLFKNGQHKKGEDLNHGFLIDYFASSDTTASTGKALEISMGNLELVDGKFVYFRRQTQAAYPEMDPDYLVFDRINIGIRDVKIDEKSLIRGQIYRFATRERSGLEVVEGTAVLDITNNYIDLRKMELKTPCSRIRDRVKIMFDSWTDFDEVETDVNWLFDIKDSEICLEELVAFHPWFEQRKLLLLLSGKATGTFANLQSNDVWIRGDESNTNLRGALQLKHLVELSQFEYHYQLENSSVDMGDLSRVVYELDSVPVVRSFGPLEVQGKLNGTLNWVDFDGWLNNKIASYSGYTLFDYTTSVELTKYQLLGELQRLELNQLPEFFPNVAVYDTKVDVNGTGFYFPDVQLNSLVKIGNLQYEDRTLKGISVTASLLEDNVEYLVDSKDTGFRLSSIGSIENLSSNPHFQGGATVQRLVLNGMGLDSVPLSMSGSVDYDFAGSTLAKSKFWITADNAQFNIGQNRYYCKEQQINKDPEKGWEFDGSWLQGNITAGFNIDQTEELVQLLLHSQFPDDFEKPVFAQNQDFQFNIRMIQTDWISQFVVKNLSLGLVNAIGSVSTAKNKMDVEVGPLEVSYNDIELQKLQVSLHTDEFQSGRLQVSTGSAAIGKTKYDELAIGAVLKQGQLSLALGLHDEKDRYQLSLQTESTNEKDSLNTQFASTQLRLYNNPWYVDPDARLNYVKGKRWDVNRFVMADADHYLEVSGAISKSLKDTLHVEFHNLTPQVLAPFFPENTFDTLDFHASADFKVAGVLGDQVFLGTCMVNNLTYYGYNYGSIDVDLRDAGKQGLLGIAARGRKGAIKGLALLGSVDLLNSEKWVDMYLDVPLKTPAKILKPFLDGAVTVNEGYLDGVVNIVGPTNKIQLDGEINARDVLFGVDYLGTFYRFSGKFDVNTNGVFTQKPIDLTGKTGLNGKAKASLAFTWKDYSDFALDIRVYDAKNLKVLETTEKDNSLFYGSGRAAGSCRIYGPIDKINIIADLTPEKNAKVSILYPSSNENYISNGVVFRDRDNQDKEIKSAQIVSDEEESVLGKIEVVIHANTNLEAEFVIDKKLGDIIRGRGKGDLRLLYDENEDLFLFGAYVIANGEYQFSLPGINLTKKMLLDDGGLITWTGDPYNANVSMIGKVQKRISPSQLMSTMGGSGTNYPATLIVSQLLMTGNLMRPNISFDILAPELEKSGGSNSEVNAVIQRIRQDKDETMRQSIALLLFGNFMPPSFSNGSAGAANMLSGAGVAGNSVSNIASNVVNDLFAKAGIPTRIQVNYDDVRSASRGSNGLVFINSEWFLSDRLRLDVNYDPTVSMVGLAMPFNLNLEYMTRNDHWKLKAFSRSSNMLLQQAGTTTNGVSGNTLGTGLVYRREFDSFKRRTNNSPATVESP